ncbi:MAG: amidoligase family protein [Paracoccaceae bacterium]
MSEFATLVERIPLGHFWPLPRPTHSDGRERQTGVEIEFSGLAEGDAAEVVKDLWGGTVNTRAPHDLVVEGGSLGDVQVELDTALKGQGESPLADKLLDLSREVVPVEIVTPPLPPSDLPEIDRLMAALNEAGALGSEEGVLLAFGVHLNPEVASETAEFIVPVVRAFALVEQWLRASDPPDISRRLLPFVDPWPRSFVDRAAEEGAGWSLSDLRDAYLELVPSRNHGLDLLPLLEHLFPGEVRAALPEGQVKGGRPTWHYRLPETGLGAADWSFAYEWNRWVLVERIAERPSLLEQLAEAWAAHRSALTTLRPDWAHDVNGILERADIWER